MRAIYPAENSTNIEKGGQTLEDSFQSLPYHPSLSTLKGNEELLGLKMSFLVVF